MSNSEASVDGYRIGAIARLTGISPDTLRIWERRYNVVTPQRSSGGGRLYTSDGVARLKMIGRLVDRGGAIGVVAGLSHDELLPHLILIPASSDLRRWMPVTADNMRV